MPKISVVIPAFNESARIEETLRSSLDYLRSQSEPFEVIVSDDGSTDDTKQKIKALIAQFGSVKIVEGGHAGKAAAVRAGVEASLGDYLVMMDADGAVSLDQMEKLFKQLKENNADLAIGSREGSGAQRISEPYYRHCLGRIFNAVVKLLTGLRFEDTQCGFKLFRGPVIKELAARSTIMNQNRPHLKEPLVTAFDVELLVLAQRQGYKTVEVPITWRHLPTRNVNPIKDSLRMLRDVLKIRLNLIRGKYRLSL